MPTAEAHVQTEHPSRYLAQLCKHARQVHRLRHRPPTHDGGDPQPPPKVQAPPDRNRWHRQLQLGPVHPAGQPTRSRSAPKPPARKPAAGSGNRRQRHREIRQARTPEGRLATAPSAHNPAWSSQLSKQQVGPACVLSPLLGPVGLRPLMHPAAWISRGSCRPAVTGRPNGDLFYRRNGLRNIPCGQPVVSTHALASAATMARARGIAAAPLFLLRYIL